MCASFITPITFNGSRSILRAAIKTFVDETASVPKISRHKRHIQYLLYAKEKGNTWEKRIELISITVFYFIADVLEQMALSDDALKVKNMSPVTTSKVCHLSKNHLVNTHFEKTMC